MVFTSCMTVEKNPVFDHKIIKQVNKKSPSFLILIEKDTNNYYTNKIEDILIENNIPVIVPDVQTIETKSTGLLLYQNKPGLSMSKGKSTIRNDTTADCILQMNFYGATGWGFKIISGSNRELLMKGTIKYDLKQEIPQMLKELIIQ